MGRRVQPKLYRKTEHCWVIGHRGYPAAAPENTLASFDLAMKAGVDMIELDVTLSADGVPVVIHDTYLHRTTDGKGAVRRTKLSALRRLDAGAWYGKRFSGQRIPTLDEVLKLIRGKVAVNIEIKKEAVEKKEAGGIEQQVIGLVTQHAMNGHTVVSSFSVDAVTRVKQRSPSLSVALLWPRLPKEDPLKTLGHVGADAVHLSVKGLREEDVKMFADQGIPVRVYTVNDPNVAKQMTEWGVEGIFTDDADGLGRFVRMD